MKKSLFAAILAFFAMPAFAVDDDYIYCAYVETFADVGEKRVFYTGVFLGDYSWTVGYRNDFRKHIEEQYPDSSPFSHYCFFEKSYAAAEREMQKGVKDHQRVYGKVLLTGWTPDNFSTQPLQDFHIAIDDDSADLEICVRDHECEDGDRVRVSVDNSSVFSGEINNGWACREVRVQAGRDYAIELFAINGTGHKGQCSYRDANTGEIRVRGDTEQTQSWRHRGGAGSRARIIVRAK